MTSVLACRATGEDVVAGSDEGDQWAWFDPNKLPDNLISYARTWLTDALEQPRSACFVR